MYDDLIITALLAYSEESSLSLMYFVEESVEGSTCEDIIDWEVQLPNSDGCRSVIYDSCSRSRSLGTNFTNISS